MSVTLVPRSSLFQPPEDGEDEDENKDQGEDGDTKIPIDQYYPDDYDQYDEGRRKSPMDGYHDW